MKVEEMKNFSDFTDEELNIIEDTFYNSIENAILNGIPLPKDNKSSDEEANAKITKAFQVGMALGMVRSLLKDSRK